MAEKHGVIRTDLVSGTAQPADLVSLRYYGTEGSAVADCDNGIIVKLEGYENGEREVYKAKAATGEDELNDCAIVAGVEIMYDERYRSLDEYYNEAGKAIRGYIPRSRNLYGFTKECFESGTAPTKDQTIGIGTGGKLKAGGTGFGKCVHIETVGRFTYYTIRIDKTEGTKAAE